MNILFSAGYLYRYPFANNNIEILLANTLSKMDCTCYVYGFSNDLCGETTLPSGTTLVRHNPYPLFERALCKLEAFAQTDTTGASRATIAKRFALRHPFAASLVILSRRPFFTNKMTKHYAAQMAQFATKHHVDAMICFAYPFEFVAAVAESAPNIPFLYYQFDPYGLHEHIPEADRAAHIAQEVAAIATANRTITTQVLYQHYAAHPAYQPYLSKCCAMDFPAFCEKASTDCAPAFKFEKSNINVLFCGTIDDGFRSPAYLLETCVPLFEQMPNLRLFFLGSITSNVLTDFAARYPEHILLHPIVESDVANKTIAQADILLNIGNSISNMMPSKIFDYFATGKPIVNVQKIAHCPAQPYFARYPMQITLAEFTAQGADSQAAQGDESNQLATFLRTHKGKQLAFDEVYPLYKTATPQYVAAELKRMIKELVE